MTADEFDQALHKELQSPIVGRTINVGHAVIREAPKDRRHNATWAFATVSLAQQRVQVQVNLNLKRGKLGDSDYQRLRDLAFRGIQRYWSRSVKIAGQTFAVQVNALYGTGKAVEVDLAIEKGTDYARSYNPSIFGIDGTFYYNAGYYGSTAQADANFMETAAHEFGHAVLMVVGGLNYSWTHKGSTTIFQNVKSSTPGYPTAGDVDLMRYYDDEKSSADTVSQAAKRTKADEWDVKCLLLISKLTF